MSKPQPRLKDIAAEAGVSLTCVSLALADHPRISEATRERVREVAARVGYQPNQAARLLQSFKGGTGRAEGALGTLAMVLSFDLKEQMARPHMGRWLECYRQETFAAGYGFDCFDAPREASQAKSLDRVLFHRGISGVIVAAANQIPPWQIDWSRYAVVANSWPAPCPFHTVGGDRFRDLFLLTQKVLGIGYVRPGLIHSGAGFEGWIGGFMEALKKSGCPRAAPPLRMAEWDAAVAVRWFKRYRPDVIIANHGLTLVHDFARAGFPIPESVAYCSPDVLPEAPGLAGLIQPRGDIARLTVDLLLGHMRRNESGYPRKPINVALPPDWVDGTTLPGLNKTRS